MVPDHGGPPRGRAEALVAGLLAGDRRALSRALTAVENESADALAVLRGIYPRLGRSRVIGVTGAAGTGKSTLIAGLIRTLRARGLTVGVLAVDPSSPFSGGAVLGDRIRMAEHDLDDGVFVRSLSSRGEVGGLSRQAVRLVDVMDAFGFDAVLLETVGTGQSEVAVVEVAPTRLVVMAPGLGDEIQALKAGLLEIADLFVVNKADLPEADRTAAQLQSLVPRRLREAKAAPVHLVSARKGDGLEELVAAALAHADAQLAAGRGDAVARARLLLAAEAGRQAQALVKTAGGAASDLLDSLAEALAKGDKGLAEAGRDALKALK